MVGGTERKWKNIHITGNRTVIYDLKKVPEDPGEEKKETREREPPERT